jgi:hypothetical protein
VQTESYLILFGMQMPQEADTEAACWHDLSANAFKQSIMAFDEHVSEIVYCKYVFYSSLEFRGVAVGGVENLWRTRTKGSIRR